MEPGNTDEVKQMHREKSVRQEGQWRPWGKVKKEVSKSFKYAEEGG